jgi:hypothetical protein
MAFDIFYGLSKAELKKEIDALIAKDARTLPPRAKVFAAVASKQGYDQLPDRVPFQEIEARNDCTVRPKARGQHN